MTTLIDHLHYSGWFGSSESEVHSAYESLIDRYTPDIVTGTECDYQSHKTALAGFADVYNMRVGSETYADDTIIMWKKEKWKLVHFEAYQVTKIAYVNEKGRLRDPAWAKIVVLEHIKTGKRVLVSVLHAPSSVQKGAGFKVNSTRVRAWHSGVRGWRKRRNAIYRKFKCDAMLACADWNADWKSKTIRAIIQALHPSMKFVLDSKHIPGSGTLGNRLIDFTLIRGSLRVMKRPTILAKFKASDHRPYWEVLAFTDK
jgi:hypothetical protein